MTCTSESPFTPCDALMCETPVGNRNGGQIFAQVAVQVAFPAGSTVNRYRVRPCPHSWPKPAERSQRADGQGDRRQGGCAHSEGGPCSSGHHRRVPRTRACSPQCHVLTSFHPFKGSTDEAVRKIASCLSSQDQAGKRRTRSSRASPTTEAGCPATHRPHRRRRRHPCRCRTGTAGSHPPGWPPASTAARSDRDRS